MGRPLYVKNLFPVNISDSDLDQEFREKAIMIAALYVLNMVLYDCIVQVGGESYRRAFALPVETKEKWDGVEPLAKFLWRNGGYAWNQRHWEHVWCATEDLSEMY